MTKAERLLRIIDFLHGRHRAVSAARLAEELDVSVRTVYRDVQSLQQSGVCIEGEAGVGYLLNEQGTLPPMSFTVEEIEALTLGARLVKSCADQQLSSAIDQAVHKIRAVLPRQHQQQLERRKASMLVVPNMDSKYSRYADVARQAIQQQQMLQLRYQDVNQNSSERLIQGLGLVYWGYCWHLTAWCEARQGFRNFRLDRMQSLTLTENANRQPSLSIDDYLKEYAPEARTGFWDF